MNAKKGCFQSALFSEYDVVAETVVPEILKLHGKRLIRANEQGQEQLGQRVKRCMKFNGNRRRTFSWCMRKLKNGGEKRVEARATVSTTSFEQVLMQNHIAQNSNHRQHSAQQRQQ